jgi:hypothetical protein
MHSTAVPVAHGLLSGSLSVSFRTLSYPGVPGKLDPVQRAAVRPYGIVRYVTARSIRRSSQLRSEAYSCKELDFRSDDRDRAERPTELGCHTPLPGGYSARRHES